MLMNILKAIYRKTGAILPRRILVRIKKSLSYAGYDFNEMEWAGMVLFTSIVAFILPFLVYLLYLQIYPYFDTEIVPVSFSMLAGIGAGLFFFTLLTFFIHLYSMISIRSESAEAVFPDFLYLISSNIRSGMIPFQAFGAAIKPELGVLAYEGKKAYEVASATNSITSAFKYLTTRIKSNSIEKFAVIFERTINAGGQAADVIKDYADDLRKLVDLKEELASQSKGYVAFLLFITAIILPFLVGVSVHYIRVLTAMSSIAPGSGEEATQAAASAASSFGGSGNAEKLSGVSFNVKISPEEFTIISAVFVLITTFSTSLLIGLVRKGELLRGIKYFPFLALSAFFVMFLSLEGLKMMMPIS